MDDHLPPPVSLDGVPLPPLPEEPYSLSTAEINDRSPRKNSTRKEGSNSKTSEKDDSSAESAQEVIGSTGIKRPLNRFFLYKVWAQPHYVKAYPGTSNQIISKMISRDWHNRSDHVKDHFARLAVWEKAKHAQQYPNYKYQPKTNRSVKRKFEKGKDKPEVAKPESAKPPIQSLHSSDNNYDPCAYSMNRSQFSNFSLQNQYELYGNPNDRPLYPELPKMLPLLPEGLDHYLQQMEMESASRGHAATQRKTQFQQSAIPEFHPAVWQESSRDVHGVYFGNSRSSASSNDSVELHHNSMALNSPFPNSSSLGPDAKVLSAYQGFIKSQCENLPRAHFRSSEYAKYSGSSGSEQPDSSEVSDACPGDVEDNDDNTTIYDKEIELLQERLVELRRLKLETTRKKARRHMGDSFDSSKNSCSPTMSEGDSRQRDDASKQEVIKELGNMFHSPPTATPADSFERATATLGGSNPRYTQDRQKPGNVPMNPSASSGSPFNFYNSLSPLSNTISAYLSNAISAEDTSGYLRQLIGDEPVDHTILHQRDAPLSAGIGHPMPDDFSNSIALLRNIKREALTDSEDDSK